MASIPIDSGANRIDALPPIAAGGESTTPSTPFETHLHPAETERGSDNESRQEDAAAAHEDDGAPDATSEPRAEREDGTTHDDQSDRDAGDSDDAADDSGDGTGEDEEAADGQQIVVTVSSDAQPEVSIEAAEVTVVERTVDPTDPYAVRSVAEEESGDISIRQIGETPVDESAEAEEQTFDGTRLGDLPDDGGSDLSDSKSDERSGKDSGKQPVNAARRAAAAGVPTAAEGSRTGPVVTDLEPELLSAERRAPSKTQPGLQPSPTEGGGDLAEGAALRFGDQLLPRAGNQGERSIQLDSVQQARFVDRVARAVQAAEVRGEPLRLRLHPPELGALKLELRVQRGVLTARVETETVAARSILVENLPVLRDRLVEQGVRIEQFEVDLGGQRSGGPADDLGQDSNESKDSHSSSAAKEEETEEERGGTSQQSRTGDKQIDIVI